MTRQYTNKLLKMIKEGLCTWWKHQWVYLGEVYHHKCWVCKRCGEETTT